MEKERREEERKKKEKGRIEEEENPGLELLFGNFLCDVLNSCFELLYGNYVYGLCMEISLCLSCVGKILLEVLLVGMR